MKRILIILCTVVVIHAGCAMQTPYGQVDIMLDAATVIDIYKTVFESTSRAGEPMPDMVYFKDSAGKYIGIVPDNKMDVLWGREGLYISLSEFRQIYKKVSAGGCPKSGCMFELQNAAKLVAK